MSDVKLSDEQREAVWNIMARIGTQQVQTLGGYAGTGKTTVLTTLSEKLPDYCVCAYTGKAASILRRKGIDSASTIHGAIYDCEEDPVTKKRTFRRKPYLGGVKGFIIDEASMVDEGIYQDLLGYNVPIIAIGDHGQLPPVGKDAGLMLNPEQRLEKIHRNAGPIARFAEYVRNGNPAAGYGDSTGTVTILPRRSRLDPEQVKQFDQIICAFNKDRVRMNLRMMEILNRNPEPGEGMRVMCLRNSREFGVFNGQQGIIERMSGSGFIFKPDFMPSCYVEPHPDSWNKERPPEYRKGDRRVPFDFAYCISGHKSQGDQFGSVFVVEQRSTMWEHSRWAYTVASRAMNKLMWLPA